MATIAFALALTVGGQRALAAPAQIVLDKDTADLTPTDNGWTATVTLENVTDHRIPITASAGRACGPLRIDDLDGAVLPPASHTEVTISLPAECRAEANPKGFSFLVGPAGPSPPMLKVTARRNGPSVDWSPLAAFLVSTGVALAWILVVLANWWWHRAPRVNIAHISQDIEPVRKLRAAKKLQKTIRKRHQGGSGEPTQEETRAQAAVDAAARAVDKQGVKTGFSRASRFLALLRAPLDGLEKSWTFNDSMLSSITAGSGIFITVLGASNVLDDVLGDDAKKTVGVVTVAGAIAAALTGASGILDRTLRKPGSPNATVGGVLASSTIAFGAAAGQVWAIVLLLNELKLNFAGPLLYVSGVLSSLVLMAYAFTSLTGLLSVGTEPPPKLQSQVVPDEVYAAAIIAAASPNAGAANGQQVETLLKDLRADEVKAEDKKADDVKALLSSADKLLTALKGKAPEAVEAEEAAVGGAAAGVPAAGAAAAAPRPTPPTVHPWRARRLRERSVLP